MVVASWTVRSYFVWALTEEKILVGSGSMHYVSLIQIGVGER